LKTLEYPNTFSYSAPFLNTVLDNVFIERFWRSLKQEKIYLIILNTVKEAKNAITSYITFYNQKRMHQSLEYLTPEQVYFGKTIV
jgi:putative transposase